MRAFGGFYLRFDRSELAEGYREKVLYAIRLRTAEPGPLGERSPVVSWDAGIVRSGEYLFVEGTRPLDPVVYRPNEAARGGTLFQLICRAIAEETMEPFEGMGGYTETDAGVQQAICVRCDGQNLVFRVVDARSVMFVDMRFQGEDVREMQGERHPDDPAYLTALRGNMLFSLDIWGMTSRRGDNLHIYDQRWAPDDEWPYGGWMPYVMIDDGSSAG